MLIFWLSNLKHVYVYYIIELYLQIPMFECWNISGHRGWLSVTLAWILMDILLRFEFFHESWWPHNALGKFSPTFLLNRSDSKVRGGWLGWHISSMWDSCRLQTSKIHQHSKVFQEQLSFPIHLFCHAESQRLWFLIISLPSVVWSWFFPCKYPPGN